MHSSPVHGEVGVLVPGGSGVLEVVLALIMIVVAVAVIVVREW